MFSGKILNKPIERVILSLRTRDGFEWSKGDVFLIVELRLALVVRITLGQALPVTKGVDIMDSPKRCRRCHFNKTVFMKIDTRRCS